MNTLSYAKALETLSSGECKGITRVGWNGTAASPVIRLQVPDENSFMTEPYLYMEKYNAYGKVARFPVLPSCESMNERDWILIHE